MSTLHLNNGSRRFWVFFVTPVSDSSQQPWSFIVPSRSVILRRSCVLLKCSSSPTSCAAPPLAVVCVNVNVNSPCLNQKVANQML